MDRSVFFVLGPSGSGKAKSLEFISRKRGFIVQKFCYKDLRNQIVDVKKNFGGKSDLDHDGCSDFGQSRSKNFGKDREFISDFVIEFLVALKWLVDSNSQSK